MGRSGQGSVNTWWLNCYLSNQLILSRFTDTVDTGLKSVAPAVVGVTNGSSGAGWLQESAATARITAPVTNATATPVNLTDLTITLIAGRKYFGRLVLWANNSTGAEGLQILLNGGTATVTSIEFGFPSTPVGGTLGVSNATALATALTVTVVSTSDVCYVVEFEMVCNAAGTFIPSFGEVSHSTGTATVNNGSLRLFDSPN